VAEGLKVLHQLVPSFSSHDAIGNEVLLIQKHLRNRGLESEIFFEQAGDEDYASKISRLDGRLVNAGVLYHYSIASWIPARIAPWRLKKLVRYHNITPPEFFDPVTEPLPYYACRLGRRQAPLVGLVADGILAASDYSARELAPFTDTPPAHGPVWRDYDALVSQANEAMAERLGIGKARTDILFIGRICPNKAQQDLLLLTRLAKTHVAPDVRLVLVGQAYSKAYADKIVAYAKSLGLRVCADASVTREALEADVLFLEGLRDSDLGGLYKRSRAYVSMSEHEGFGVPLVEAMHFDLPVLAHAAAAIPETVGDAGVVVNKADWAETLAGLAAVLKSEETRARLIDAGRRRRRELDLPAARRAFDAWLARFV
jgi:glycosyltransferase involved in cell wall biosynthesis